MKIKMLPKTYRIIAKFWPLICGLIIGGLLGGIMHSFSFFMLFGAIGWAYFYFDFFHVPDGTPCVEPGHGEDYGSNLRNELSRQSEELAMAAAGIEPYASAYGYSTDD
jgi:hypothetical protein